MLSKSVLPESECCVIRCMPHKRSSRLPLASVKLLRGVALPNAASVVAALKTGQRLHEFLANHGAVSLNTVSSDWKLMLAMGGAAVAAVAMIAYAFFRPAEDPEAIERKRRLHLNQIGRIAEGQVVELVAHPPEPRATKGLFGSRTRPLANLSSRQLVSYSYAISGVTYQTAQDITGLESQVRFDRLVAGQPASVKYDPSNPTDSILVADDWSGLR